MKLSIIQMTLGVLILLVSCYIVGWMILGAQSLLTMPVPDASDVMVNTNVHPQHETLFTAARYASGLIFGLGLVALLTGAFQNKAGNGKKLAITQIIAGVLITVVSIFITRWGYPLAFIAPMPEGSNLLKSVNINPGPPMVFAMFLTMLAAILGLAITGIGITQFIKARR